MFGTPAAVGSTELDKIKELNEMGYDIDWTSGVHEGPVNVLYQMAHQIELLDERVKELEKYKEG